MEKRKRLELDINNWLSAVEECMDQTAHHINTTMKWKNLPIRIMKRYAKKQVYWHWFKQISPPVVEKGKKDKDRNVRVKKGMYKYLGSKFGWKEVNNWNMRWMEVKENKKIYSNDNKREIFFILSSPKNKTKLIFSNTAKKFIRLDKQIKKLYEVRKEFKKLRKKLQEGERIYDIERTYKKVFKQFDETVMEIEKIKFNIDNIITEKKRRKQSKFRKRILTISESGDIIYMTKGSLG